MDGRKIVISFTTISLWAATGIAADARAPAYATWRDIPEPYRWRLEDIFASPTSWKAERAAVEREIAGLASLRGTLGASPAALADALKRIFDVQERLDRLSVYASMLSDQDTREPEPRAMAGAADLLWNQLGATLAFVEPELLALPDAQIAAFFAAESRLAPYRVYLDRIRRMKPHILSDAEERLLAQAGTLTGNSGKAFKLLSNAELPYPTITLADGGELFLNVPGYERARTLPNRDDRIKAFQGFYGTLRRYRHTLGSLLYSRLLENVFHRNARKYDSSLQMALFPEKMPPEVYTTLISTVRANLPLLHRYLKIRKRMLGLDTLGYHDFYPPLVQGVDTLYSYEEGASLVRKALRPLGTDYLAFLEKAFEDRWIDVFPTPGKASGAYCNYVYGLHPYVKINFNGRYADVSMMAHELGHAVHSCLAGRVQPYSTFNTDSFPAEVASTTNEALLKRQTLADTVDPRRRLALLGDVLEGFRQTIFRQTLFAEFYYEINRRAEKGDVLTGDDFDHLYLDLLRTYYGHPETTAIDDLYAHEWAYIGHFYIGYYHYYYSISFAAAEAIAEALREKGSDMPKKYVRMLEAGGSVAPIDLLRQVGVDMTTPAPMALAMRNMARLLDEMEKLLAARGAPIPAKGK